ncbi:hypothetical protein PHAVU_003G175500 [Phaseolus vulgaris]|uniref:Uncharacterized protein n=1 Tax=Phaseolus vulgaris TaxID=3885 RepID=V7CAB6_PHAVU|nr:hypothetical protein PHAVU_003G175500g [Phaseolus vulgaris]XP_007155124.1 hypothetical protein PHAVU_003G175500g [Phaseolus vulgaris]ESW27117.1 hypothetical protein PHAVU_003G175500g [Phaseolus vulgaris]ESW27118.1 hypothetical protein PHAVU_003G175500g [Phaseolus vulgaris]
MGTAILRSHDCLQGRFLPNEAFAIATSRVASRTNSNPNHNHAFTSPAHQIRRRKRSPAIDRDRRRSSDRSPANSPSPVNLVMGQVKILKRGEKLSLLNNHADVRSKREMGLDLLLGSTDRLGPDPLTVQKQIRVSDPNNGVYAGSAFVSSPHPSSVPVPGFLGRNGAATSDLRRLLRLDLE